MPADLEIHEMTVTYDGALALDRVSLEATAGTVTAVLGHNGAGKSSLLRAVAGVVPVAAGQVLWRGRRLLGDASSRSRAGVRLVSESGNVFSDLSVLDNLRSGAPWTARGDVSGRVDEVLEVFPRLTDLLTQRAGTLSGGQRQMVAVGRALYSRPELLLLDEPSLGLAPRVARETIEKVARLAVKRKLTILLAEQNLNLALGHAAKGHVLEVGRVSRSGDASDLLAELTPETVL